MKTPNRSSKKQTTEIVYVVSPDKYQYQLFSSLRSLLVSGTSFDRIIIFCVGKRPKYWQFEDSRIVVEEVDTLNKTNFFFNKIYSCSRKSERLIFLDTDTIIMKSIDSVYEGVDDDFLARPVGGYPNSIWGGCLVAGSWDLTKWENMLRMVNAKADTPYINSGFFICQNSSHHKLGEIWLKSFERLLKGDPMRLFKDKWCEQAALSLAVGVVGMSCHLLDRTQHAYGWNKNPFEDTVVYHTGGRYFWNHAIYLESFLEIQNLDLPKFKGSPYII